MEPPSQPTGWVAEWLRMRPRGESVHNGIKGRARRAAEALHRGFKDMIEGELLTAGPAELRLFAHSLCGTHTQRLDAHIIAAEHTTPQFERARCQQVTHRARCGMDGRNLAREHTIGACAGPHLGAVKS